MRSSVRLHGARTECQSLSYVTKKSLGHECRTGAVAYAFGGGGSGEMTNDAGSVAAWAATGGAYAGRVGMENASAASSVTVQGTTASQQSSALGSQGTWSGAGAVLASSPRCGTVSASV